MIETSMIGQIRLEVQVPTATISDVSNASKSEECWGCGERPRRILQSSLQTEEESVVTRDRNGVEDVAG
jgi:hypothetical protein